MKTTANVFMNDDSLDINKIDTYLTAANLYDVDKVNIIDMKAGKGILSHTPKKIPNTQNTLNLKHEIYLVNQISGKHLSLLDKRIKWFASISEVLNNHGVDKISYSDTNYELLDNGQSLAIFHDIKGLPANSKSEQEITVTDKDRIGLNFKLHHDSKKIISCRYFHGNNALKVMKMDKTRDFILSDFSVSCFFSATSLPYAPNMKKNRDGYMDIICFNDLGSLSSYNTPQQNGYVMSLSVDYNGNLSFSCRIPQLSKIYSIDAGKIELNKMYEAIVVHRIQDKTLALYLDGKKIGSVKYDVIPLHSYRNIQTLIGGGMLCRDGYLQPIIRRHFRGYIGGVIFFDKAFEDDEISHYTDYLTTNLYRGPYFTDLSNSDPDKFSIYKLNVSLNSLYPDNPIKLPHPKKPHITPVTYENGAYLSNGEFLEGSLNVGEYEGITFIFKAASTQDTTFRIMGTDARSKDEFALEFINGRDFNPFFRSNKHRSTIRNAFINDGSMHEYMITFNSKGGVLYRDGKKIGSVKQPIAKTSSLFRVGKVTDTAKKTYAFTGVINDLVIIGKSMDYSEYAKYSNNIKILPDYINFIKGNKALIPFCYKLGYIDALYLAEENGNPMIYDVYGQLKPILDTNPALAFKANGADGKGFYFITKGGNDDVIKTLALHFPGMIYAQKEYKTIFIPYNEMPNPKAIDTSKLEGFNLLSPEDVHWLKIASARQISFKAKDLGNPKSNNLDNDHYCFSFWVLGRGIVGLTNEEFMEDNAKIDINDNGNTITFSNGFENSHSFKIYNNRFNYIVCSNKGIWINGEQVYSTWFKPFLNSPHDFGLGTMYDYFMGKSKDGSFDGYIEDFKMSNVAMTDEEIKQIYNDKKYDNFKKSIPFTLLRYYEMHSDTRDLMGFSNMSWRDKNNKGISGTYKPMNFLEQPKRNPMDNYTLKESIKNWYIVNNNLSVVRGGHKLNIKDGVISVEDNNAGILNMLPTNKDTSSFSVSHNAKTFSFSGRIRTPEKYDPKLFYTIMSIGEDNFNVNLHKEKTITIDPEILFTLTPEEISSELGDDYKQMFVFQIGDMNHHFRNYITFSGVIYPKDSNPYTNGVWVTESFGVKPDGQEHTFSVSYVDDSYFELYLDGVFVTKFGWRTGLKMPTKVKILSKLTNNITEYAALGTVNNIIVADKPFAQGDIQKVLTQTPETILSAPKPKLYNNVVNKIIETNKHIWPVLSTKAIDTKICKDTKLDNFNHLIEKASDRQRLIPIMQFIDWNSGNTLTVMFSSINGYMMHLYTNWEIKHIPLDIKLTNNNWHFLSFGQPDDSDNITIYIDGIETATIKYGKLIGKIKPQMFLASSLHPKINAEGKVSSCVCSEIPDIANYIKP